MSTCCCLLLLPVVVACCCCLLLLLCWCWFCCVDRTSYTRLPWSCDEAVSPPDQVLIPWGEVCERLSRPQRRWTYEDTVLRNWRAGHTRPDDGDDASSAFGGATTCSIDGNSSRASFVSRSRSVSITALSVASSGGASGVEPVPVGDSEPDTALVMRQEDIQLATPVFGSEDERRVVAALVCMHAAGAALVEQTTLAQEAAAAVRSGSLASCLNGIAGTVRRMQAQVNRLSFVAQHAASTGSAPAANAASDHTSATQPVYVSQAGLVATLWRVLSPVFVPPVVPSSDDPTSPRYSADATTPKSPRAPTIDDVPLFSGCHSPMFRLLDAFVLGQSRRGAGRKRKESAFGACPCLLACCCGGC